MKTSNFFKSIAIAAMVAFVAIGANAQSVVNGISTRDAQACGEYLVKNPLDTIVNVSNINKEGMRGVVKRSVYLKNNSLVAFNDTTWYRQTIQSVEVSKTNVVVTSQLQNATGEVKNDTTVFDRQSSNEIAFEKKERALRDEIIIVDDHHKDLDGNFRHKTQATVLGGGLVVNGSFSPVVTGRLGYETCHFLFELQGDYSFSQKYTEVAQKTGSYSSFSAQFNAGWKFWQDRRYRHFIAILGTAGCGYQKTDGDNTEACSKNYGFIGGGMLRGSYALTKYLRLVAEGGYKIIPKVNHNEDQDLSNGGFFFNVGLGFAW